METGVSKRQIAINLVSLATILGGIYFVLHHFGITEVRETIQNAGIWAPLVLVIAKASTVVIAPLGGSPLYPLAGALFGFWQGTGLLLLGDAIGGTIAFFLSRFFGRRIVERMIGDDQKFLGKALRMMGTVKGFLVARICFMPIPEVVAYGAGLTRIPYIYFFPIFISIGAIPVALLSALGSALTLGTWWILPAAIVAGMIVVPAGFFLFRTVLHEWEETH